MKKFDESLIMNGYSAKSVVLMAESLGFKVESITPKSLTTDKIVVDGTFDDDQSENAIYFGTFLITISNLNTGTAYLYFFSPAENKNNIIIHSIVSTGRQIITDSIFLSNQVATNLEDNSITGTLCFNGFKLIVSR